MPEQGKPDKEHTYRSLLLLDFSVWICNALYLMKNCLRCFILFEPHLKSLSLHHKTQETRISGYRSPPAFRKHEQCFEFNQIFVNALLYSISTYSLRTSYRLGAEGAEGLISVSALGLGLGLGTLSPMIKGGCRDCSVFPPENVIRDFSWAPKK